MRKGISILGSTGSIGRQTLDVVSLFPSRFKVVGLSAKDELADIEAQIDKFNPKLVSTADEETASKLKQKIKKPSVSILSGSEGIKQVATAEGVDTLVVAIPGITALLPTLEAIALGKNIALATKEILVAAGELIIQAVHQHKVKLMPLDSEHSAIFQCLQGEDRKNIKKIILTASGGPFLNTPKDMLSEITSKEALKHPTWKMGPKITIDSATLMNKGLEVIEAHFLFGLDYCQIEVVIHPQSIIHSMVEFVDGSIMAQLSSPNMHLPIQYALTYPERFQSEWSKLDLTKTGNLSFFKPDLQKFPCLELAYTAGKRGGTLPAVLNGANEEAVKLFLAQKIGFMDIPKLIKNTMDGHTVVDNPTLEKILEADKWARERTRP